MGDVKGTDQCFSGQEHHIKIIGLRKHRLITGELKLGNKLGKRTN